MLRKLFLEPRLSGPLLILASTFFYATHGVWSKWSMPFFDTLSSSWSRSLIVVALLVPILFLKRDFVWPKRDEVKWLLAIIIPGMLVTPLYFYSFVHLSVGVATLIFFTCYTLGALGYGRLFFDERLTRIKIIALFLGITGLSLVALPYFQSGSLLAIIGCGFAGFCGAAEITFTKKLPGRYSGYYLTFLLYLATAILTFALAVLIEGDSVFALPTTPMPWLVSLGYAVTIVLAIILVIRGFRSTTPGVGGIIGLMEVVFGVVFGMLLFGENVSVTVLVGAVLIAFAALLPLWKRASKSRDNAL
jgi:drug/metabolite transporter (DMT)-like permease